MLYLKKIWLKYLSIILGTCLITTGCTPRQNKTLKIIGSPNQVGYKLDRQMIDIFEKETGIKVELIRGPESATERLAYYMSLFNSDAHDIDIFYIDIIWPAILEKYMIDLAPYFDKEIKHHFKTIIKNNTIYNKLIGIPFFTDAGILYYRKDLLEKYKFKNPPLTWDELEKQAKYIQNKERKKGRKNFWGYVWQGAPYEGLTCNALEWQYSHNAGTIISSQGVIQVNNEDAIKAFKRASNWLGTISPLSTLGFQEEDSRSIWQQGDALFMRNWPYAYAKSQQKDSIIKNKFDVTILPTNDELHAAALGGWQLSIAKLSKNKENAIKLVKFLSSEKIQKKRAILGSYLPTRKALYDDPDIIKKNPFFSKFKHIFTGGAVARPSKISCNRYDRVSMLYFRSIHQILKKKQNINSILNQLEKDLSQLMQNQQEQ